MSEKLFGSNDQITANDVIKDNKGQLEQCPSAFQAPTSVDNATSFHESTSFQIINSKSTDSNSASNQPFSSDSKSIPSHPGVLVATASSSPATNVYLSTVSIATHSTNGFHPEMITTNNAYKMAAAPVFMTPSAYPQVAVIPEGDLLRSMIVQDVRQVTEKLLEKNGKKKRGRRSRKEKVMHGDFGTLKVNFKKFFKEQPPMTLAEPVPKKTVYQRIAPRHPVACTVTNPMSTSCTSPDAGQPGIVTKAARKMPGALSNSSSAETGSKTQRRSYKTARLKKRNSKSATKQDARSLEVNPASSQLAGTSVSDSGIVFVSPDKKLLETDPYIIPKDYPTSDAPAANGLNSFRIDEFVTALSGFPDNRTEVTTQSDVTLDLSSELCNGLGKASNEHLGLREKTADDVFNMSLPSLITNSHRTESSPLLNGDVTTYSVCPTSAPSEDIAFSVDACVSSPGEIGSEFNNLLSELYTDFPSLCPTDLYDKMDIVTTTEGLVLNTQSTNTSLPVDTPVSSFSSCENPISCHATTEVVNDSLWTCAFENNPFSNATEMLNSMPGGESESKTGQEISEIEPVALETNNNFSGMEIDVAESRDLVDVIDISPEYASTEGDGKIILIGSWNNKAARYSCRFGDVSAPADLIQNGVLRCFCPAYKPGKVKVSVLCDDVVLSKPVDFEYVDTEEKPERLNHDWLTIKDDDLKQLLIERIEALCGIFDSKSNIALLQGQSITTFGSDLEDVLTKICESLSAIRSTINVDCKSDKHVMTILHLSAALGFTKLIQALCNWIETNSNSIITQEASPRKQDQFLLTPLMWACAKGKFDTVCVLLQWDETTSQQTDGCGCTPLSISKGQGHTILERYLERSQSRGHSSKISCLLSDNGSPLLQMRGRLSRSSSVNSQLDHSRELHPGMDENSPDSSNGFPSFSRTLGQTLAYVQAIMQVGVEDENTRSTPLTSIDMDDDSLFVPSPFTPRTQNNSCDDIRHSAQTPRSSLSSVSPGSPAHNTSAQSPFDPSMKDTAEFCEFFYNSDRILEKDFAELTLTDEEQQNLYKAASVIQNAYKGYRVRRKQRDNELSAAVLIQSYYRRYKQYATFKKMQKGAVVIQHKYRAHREKEKQKSHAASVIQTHYRRYKERKRTPAADGLDLQQKSRILQLADRKASRFRTHTNNRNRESSGDPAGKK